MPIDFSILERAPTIAQGFMAGQQAAQQQAEQNRLRDMQMLQMEAQRENILAQRSQREQDLRERQAAEGRRNALAAAGNDPEKLIQLGPEGVKLAIEITALNKARGEVFTQRMTAARQFLDTLDPNDPTAPQRYLQWHEANHRDPIIGPMLAARGITADQARARIVQAVQQGPQALANLIAQSKLGTEKFMEQNKPFAVGGSLYDPVTRTFTQPPVKPTPGETEELVTRLQDPSLTPAARQALQARLNILTTREPKAPKEPDKPVEVVGPDGKPIIVSAQEAIAKRMTPAKAAEGLSPKEIQKREASYPKTTAALRSFETQADLLIKNLEKLREHPGLSGITGLVFGRTPAITAEARSAKADLDNILARGGFAELTAMRQASPTGGALGNISNKEVEYLRDAFGALNTVQDTETFKQKINDVIAQLQTSKRNVREEYDNTYEYRAQRGAAAPAGLSPEDKQALEWANANPRDPRAAQIKQRLGM